MSHTPIDPTDTIEAVSGHTPGPRNPAQFFFEVGYGACYADALIANDMKPPFHYSDAAIDRAWQIAPEAHEDGPEFDRFLALANAAPDLLEALENINRRASPNPERTLGGCADDLVLIADMARAAIARARGEAQ